MQLYFLVYKLFFIVANKKCHLLFKSDGILKLYFSVPIILGRTFLKKLRAHDSLLANQK